MLVTQVYLTQLTNAHCPSSPIDIFNVQTLCIHIIISSGNPKTVDKVISINNTILELLLQ